jgi:hypothetical protein
MPSRIYCRIQAAVASVTGRDVREIGLMSVQQMAFCCGTPDRGCRSGWTLDDGLATLVKCAPLLLDKCLPYKPNDLGAKTANALCSADRLCKDTSPVASKGTYSYKPLSSNWAAQVRGRGRLGGAGHGLGSGHRACFGGWKWHGRGARGRSVPAQQHPWPSTP